jgi:site-specific DNA recombinase
MERLKVVGYARVSREELDREGISMGAQRARLDSYAALYDLDLVEVVPDDGVSARTMKRPGLERVLGMLDARTVEGLVVVKLDRLTRSLRDWSDLIHRYFGEKKGLKLFSVNEQLDGRTATGRMRTNFFVMIAEWEREVIAERTSDALQHKIRTGSRCGNLKFGFDVDPGGQTNKRGVPIDLVENPAEQHVIGLIRGFAAAGRSDRAIADLLNAALVPTKTGKGPWQHSAVTRIRRRVQP